MCHSFWPCEEFKDKNKVVVFFFYSSVSNLQLTSFLQDMHIGRISIFHSFLPLVLIVQFSKRCMMPSHFLPLNKEVAACEVFCSLNPSVAKSNSHVRNLPDSLFWGRAAGRAQRQQSSRISSNSLCSIQVKSEYAQLKETLGAVTQERDLALWERNQLQDKLENLEQVLKVREWTREGK